MAKRNEWQRAERDHGYKEELLRRLENKFRPLTRDDFNGWKDMQVSAETCLLDLEIIDE